jgi:hypothetical protein
VIVDSFMNGSGSCSPSGRQFERSEIPRLAQNHGLPLLEDGIAFLRIHSRFRDGAEREGADETELAAAPLSSYPQSTWRFSGKRQSCFRPVNEAARTKARFKAVGGAPVTAIHVPHPRLLDEARLDEIRAEIVHANEEHDDGLAARQLVKREQAVAAEIRKIAGAVHEFHRVVCEVPDSSAEFRSAEAAYLRTLQEVRAHDTE